MVGEWFRSYEDTIWHMATTKDDNHCSKCSEPEMVALCGKYPDWPTWTGSPQVGTRCARCVTLMVQNFKMAE